MVRLIVGYEGKATDDGRIIDREAISLPTEAVAVVRRYSRKTLGIARDFSRHGQQDGSLAITAEINWLPGEVHPGVPVFDLDHTTLDTSEDVVRFLSASIRSITVTDAPAWEDLKHDNHIKEES